MDPLDSSRPVSVVTDADATQRELQTLRVTLQLTLAALVILSGSIGIYIFRQVSLLRRQTDATTRQAQHLAQTYNTTIAPQAQIFEKNLQEFAKGDAEFKTRIARFYAPVEPSGTNPPSPQTTPTPP